MNLIRPRSHRRPVRNEITGSLGGYTTEHWDDSMDATVLAQPATMVLRGTVNDLGERRIIEAANKEMHG